MRGRLRGKVARALGPPGCWDPEPGRALPPSLGGKGKDLYSPCFPGLFPTLDGPSIKCPHSLLPKGINKELEAFPCALGHPRCCQRGSKQHIENGREVPPSPDGSGTVEKLFLQVVAALRAALQHRLGHTEKLFVDTKYRHEECAGSPELLYFATAGQFCRGALSTFKAEAAYIGKEYFSTANWKRVGSLYILYFSVPFVLMSSRVNSVAQPQAAP